MRFFAVELVELDPADVVPDPELEQPDFALANGTEGRRAVGLRSGRPLRVRTTGRADTELAFAFAVPEPLVGFGFDAELELTIHQDGSMRSESWPVCGPDFAGDAWTDVRVPLPESGEVELQFRLQTEGDRAGACLLEVPQAIPTAERGPRVLLVTTDTHRGDHVGAADGVDVYTPNLDALADRGVLFEQCLTWTNVTNPSHISLMTGVHLRDHGIVGNKAPLVESATTLSEVFGDAGFRTFAAVSAMHLGDRFAKLGQGFDRMDTPTIPQRDGEHAVQRALEWLDGLEGEPAFLWVHVFDAHWPYEAPPGDEAHYESMLEEGEEEPFPFPGNLEAYGGVADARIFRARYKSEVTYVDRILGELFDAPGLDDDAVIAVVGDHGEHHGEHNIWFSHSGIYPQTLHVPLILSWPGGPEGARVEPRVAQGELGSTLVDIGRQQGWLEPSAELPGESLLRYLEGDVPERPHFALHSSSSSASVQVGSYYLVLHLRDWKVYGSTGQPDPSLPTYANHQVELYDLDRDPLCEVDLVDSEHERAMGLRAMLVRWMSDRVDLGWEGEHSDDPALAEQLAELGYVDTDLELSEWWVEDGCAWCQRFE